MTRERVVRFILLLIAIFAAVYLLYESWWYVREHSYDKQISKVATQYSVSPHLVKAVVWRESKFRRLCLGSKGEIGLMQVTEGAAKEWAAAQKHPAPSKTDLFNATTNLEVGTWYLRRALNRYEDCDDPAAFALAEYNAGPSNASKWRAKNKDANSSKEFVSHIGIASTRRYVQDVTAIRTKLERRGHL